MITDKKGRVLYVGNLYLGSEVDITIFKKELANFNYEKLCIWADLGFIGVKNLLNTECQIGYKRSPKKELADWQKIINYEINRVRIKVEHAIGSVKRYYILRHENRLKKPHSSTRLDLSVELCVGLHNYRMCV